MYGRQNSVLQKSYQKLFPLISCEPLRVWWCFICQTKSPNVGIKWLKLYFIPSTYTEMRASESWDSNRGTPCITTWTKSGQYWDTSPKFVPFMSRHLFILQGVPRLLSQLSEAVISLNVDGIKYHLNHLIPTLGDFVWHMKHYHTLNGSHNIKGNSFW